MLTFSLTRPVAGHTPSATEEQQLNDRARQAGTHCEYCGYESVSYTHLTLPTTKRWCRSRWSPYH